MTQETRYIAAFDAGTTAVKAALMEESGRAVRTLSEDIPTFFESGFREQDPRDWWAAFCRLSRRLTDGVPPERIEAVVMSGQMQDLIPLDGDLEPVCRAILYSDGRAQEQAERLERVVGAERFEEITGNRCDGSLPLPKLVWLREERPELFARIRHILISSKDYLIARLTGVCCGDVTACSTAGAMDIHEKTWSAPLLAAAGADPALFPPLLLPHQQAGQVLPGCDCGYLPGTPVFAGIGDAGATTLASGISHPGQYNINLGTSGWVASVSQEVLLTEAGVFNLAAAAEGHYINVVPFLNAGNVHGWVARTFAGGDYTAAGALLRASVPGSHGIFFLPYLNGERFPVLDPDIRGAYLGITPETTPADLARAALEGVAFSLRQGFDQLDAAPSGADTISLIGGGSQEPVWCQLLADVLDHELLVFRDGEYLSCLAAAAAARLGLGELSSYRGFTQSLRSRELGVTVSPDPEAAALYARRRQQYARIYPALKGVL